MLFFESERFLFTKVFRIRENWTIKGPWTIRLVRYEGLGTVSLRSVFLFLKNKSLSYIVNWNFQFKAA